MSATTERDLAIRAAPTDFPRSLALARIVSQPWFRSQALAAVARYAPDSNVVKIAEEAIAAAFESTDPYQQVAATAWAFRALLERNQEKKALQLLPKTLALSHQIPNPISHSDALFLLWEAVFPSQNHGIVLRPLVHSCTGHWKADYLLRQIVQILASKDFLAAQHLADSMAECKYKRQALKRLAAGETHPPRSFF